MGDNKLQSLSEVFNDKFFRIPDFQRGYSWGIEQLDDFWDDLSNLKDNSFHYTGLLTVEPVDKQAVLNNDSWQDDLWLFDRGYKAFFVVDGQQRLTTSIILINELLKMFNDDEGISFSSKEDWQKKFLFQTYKDSYKSYVFGYEKDNPSNEYFKTKVLDQESSFSDKVPEQTLYTANLWVAKAYFREKLLKLEKEDLEHIFRIVTSKFKYNLYEIDNELDVYVTFETMNNRGKPLSNLELLKNRLVYLSTLLEIDDSTRTRLRKDINETWKTIYEYLGKNKDNHLDDDEFLRNHWIMFFKYDRNESQSYAKFLLNKNFTAKQAVTNQLTFDDIKVYIDSLSKSVKSWFYLYNPHYSQYGDVTKEWIEKLNRLGMSAFPPLFLACMNKCEEQDFLKLLKVSEQFVFLVFRLTQRPSNTKNNYFYRLANAFYFEREGTTIDSVVNKIQWMSMGESGDGEDYEYFGWFDLDKFHAYLKDQFEKRDGFYSWNGLKYFLYEYELELQKKAKGNTKVSWSRKKDDTIEHVYPQTAKDNCWTFMFNKYKKQERRALLNSLGNLVLLAQSKNSELQNKCFDFKVKHTNKHGDETGFFNGSYSEIEIASFESWSPSEILERGERMLTFLEKRWNIDFKEWGEDGNGIDMAELLRLGFCKE